MLTVVGVRFKKAGKVYYFDPLTTGAKKSDNVVVETARGIEYGECVIGPKEVESKDIIAPLKAVIRKATQEDDKKFKENMEKEKEAFVICTEKIVSHKLDMKLIEAEYTFDNNKVIFYFTADGRVDFRELVKDLATIFRTRIELRQIGVRDEAKMIGGLAACGRAMCCSTFLGDFVPVSIKMAKEQNLSLNPSKISGICGRLMCCLNYEQDTYEDIRKRLPRVGSIVDSPRGRGEVVMNNIIKEMVRIKIHNKDEEEVLVDTPITEVSLITGSYEGIIDDREIKIEIEDKGIDAEVIKDLFKEN
ncbi:MAG TPA: stage 0 sporulation family protein [Clostridiaceae bacterium]